MPLLTDKQLAWVVNERDERTDLVSPCKVGRREGSGLHIPSPEVSREHAMLVQDEHGVWWVSDLKSVNGTFLNRRKLMQSMPLKSGDELHFGTLGFRFECQSFLPMDEDPDSKTRVAVRREACWLVVTDIIGSTRLSQELNEAVYRQHLDAWADELTSSIERGGGVVNKYIGDAILAYWRGTSVSVETLWGCLGDLRAARARFPFDFRILVHFGTVSFGGSMQVGEESIWGPTVNFIFKAERIASEHGVNDFFTEEAAALLTPCHAFQEVGEHAVTGFSGEHRFFSL